MKYLLLLISFSAIAADEDKAYMVTGICKTMLDQTNTAKINAQFLDYWKDIAESSDLTFARYHELCTILVDAFDEKQLKKGENAKGGKL